MISIFYHDFVRNLSALIKLGILKYFINTYLLNYSDPNFAQPAFYHKEMHTVLRIQQFYEYKNAYISAKHRTLEHVNFTNRYIQT